MPTYKNPVIIIQGWGGGLGIARNLGSVGIDVYCLTSHRFDPVIFSKYCKGYAVVPRIAVDSEKLKTSLNLLEKKLPRKGVIFPAGDNSVLTLSSIINELDNYISFIPDRKIVETLVLKKKFYKSLREHGVPHPLTLNTDETDLNEVEEKISLPVFIKPSHSSIFGDTFGGKKGFVANTLRELRSYLRLAEKHETDVMVQEIIPGPTSNEYVIRGYLDKRSEPVVLFANQKIRKSSMFSNPSVHKSIPISHLADFIDVIVDYLKSIKYRGLFGAEIKRDSRNGAFKLLEINARIMGVNNFPPACGVNNVLTAYLDVLGEEVQPVKDYDIGVYSIDFIKDLKIILRFLAKGQFTRETMLPYLRKKRYYLFSMDDPMPFVINHFHFLLNKLSQKS